MLGQALGLPTTMTAFAFIGVAVTSATIVLFGEAIWDPIVLIARIGGTGVIVFAALVILAAQLTTNMAANVVSPSNDFSNLSPKRISYVTGGLITAVIGILMMPWRLYADAAAYIFTWLLGYSSLMGALGGILIADYWIIRRQRLVLDDLFREQGAYTYRNGVNWRAVAAFVIARLAGDTGVRAGGGDAGGRGGGSGFLRPAVRLCLVRHLWPELRRVSRAHAPGARSDPTRPNCLTTEAQRSQRKTGTLWVCCLPSSIPPCFLCDLCASVVNVLHQTKETTTCPES